MDLCEILGRGLELKESPKKEPKDQNKKLRLIEGKKKRGRSG